MANTKEMANYITATKQRDKETVITEFVYGVQWFQMRIYKADILHNAL